MFKVPKSLIQFSKILTLIVIWSNYKISNGFFLNKNYVDEFSNLFVINSLSINDADFSLNKNDDYFPLMFKIDFYDSNTNRNISILFKKISKYNYDNEYPIVKSDIYTIDSFTGEPIRHNINNEEHEKSELYREIDGKSTATLIRNKYYDQNDKISHKFRLLATIYEKNSNGIIYDILPINFEKNQVSRKKRDNDQNILYNSKINQHGIFFRDSNSNTLNLADYIKLDYELEKRFKRETEKIKKNSNTKISGSDNKPFNLYVELLLVLDYTILNDHKKFMQTNDTELAFIHMKTYFSHYINGVNQIFQNTFKTDPDIRINLKLKNILILQNQIESNWTDRNYVGISTLVTYKNREVILTIPTLNAFKNFMNTKNFSFTYDFAIGLFNKDLWTVSGSNITQRSNIVGFSFQSEICTDSRYSIAEEIGGFLYTSVTAHELGHNLGASHDGDSIDPISSQCSSSDNYIMTPSVGVYSYNLTNQHLFSNCSIISFKNILLTNDLRNVSTQAQCLTNVPIENNQLIETNYPGQVWSADDQCKMIYGSTASFCQYLSDRICTQLSCRKSENETECSFIKGNGAATGTTCDSGKICLNGLCVNDKIAPVGDCLYGNDVVMNFQVIDDELPKTQMTCEEVIYYAKTINRYGPAYCSIPSFKETCCNLCKKYSYLTCIDNDSRCPEFLNLCDTGALFNDILIEDLCPRSCGICKDEPVSCPKNYICQNNGTCVNLKNEDSDSYIGYYCKCSTGYSGDFCQTKNPCEPNPCKNSGECVRIGSLGYKCKCKNFLTGIHCESNTGSQGPLSISDYDTPDSTKFSNLNSSIKIIDLRKSMTLFLLCILLNLLNLF